MRIWLTICLVGGMLAFPLRGYAEFFVEVDPFTIPAGATGLALSALIGFEPVLIHASLSGPAGQPPMHLAAWSCDAPAPQPIHSLILEYDCGGDHRQYQQDFPFGSLWCTGANTMPIVVDFGIDPDENCFFNEYRVRELRISLQGNAVNLDWEGIWGSLFFRVYRLDSPGQPLAEATLVGTVDFQHWSEPLRPGDTLGFYVVTTEFEW
ncbi:MAG: hypothetical protein KDC10_01155 [Calditrichaeota bacterium]|nr:hypothetical protein [Candidatus Cloacimonadota bacterium]MCA9784929.1 hypothetical protein [Candidatus Cloacimonadota bacterium]MCB1045779.1 hypothetical protein [Calditrichota bacterium]MCB9475008.1 hypothetical protein [Candidatus Delongbacteria bacterium]